MELKKRLMLMLTLLLTSFFLFGAGESLGCASEEEEEDCQDPNGCPSPVVNDAFDPSAGGAPDADSGIDGSDPDSDGSPDSGIDGSDPDGDGSPESGL